MSLFIFSFLYFIYPFAIFFHGENKLKDSFVGIMSKQVFARGFTRPVSMEPFEDYSCPMETL